MRRLLSWPAAVVVAVALAGAAAAQPPVNERWGLTSSGAASTAIAPAQGYSRGSPLTLTWGFMDDGTPLNDVGSSGTANAPSNLQARLNTIYGMNSMATVWQPLFQSVFTRWSAVSGLTYQYEANDDAAAFTASTAATQRGLLNVRADVRIGGKTIDGNSNTLAYNYFPNVGDMVLDTSDNFFSITTSTSLRLRNVVSHEHGHGLGMEHVRSNSAAFLMEPFADTTFDGPQFHDILAAHHMYGDRQEKSNAGLGNDVLARATPLGAVALNGSVSIGNSARTLTVASSAVDFVSIDGATDTDFYSFTVGQAGRATILLEALGFTYGLTDEDGNGAAPFNTRLRSDLLLQLLDANGNVLATSDTIGVGLGETIVRNLAAGTYSIRVTGADNTDIIALDAQFYGLTVSLAPVPEPGSVLLVAALAGAGGWGARRLRRR